VHRTFGFWVFSDNCLFVCSILIPKCSAPKVINIAPNLGLPLYTNKVIRSCFRITLLLVKQIYLLAGKKTGHLGAAMRASSLHHLATIACLFYRSALYLDFCSTLYTIPFKIHRISPFQIGGFLAFQVLPGRKKVRIHICTFFNIEDNA